MDFFLWVQGQMESYYLFKLVDDEILAPAVSI